MVSEELKNAIAQNCPNYDTPADMKLLSMSSIASSCNSCVNFKNGRCGTNYFDELVDMLNRN